jgi:glycosyltransferase involved in cell wall biosynthesis
VTTPLVTVAVPSFNQGKFLDQALTSIFSQDVPVEVFVLDAGSTDETLEVIQKWRHKLAGFRSHQDAGQASAINEGIAMGTAPYVCWVNSDDWLLPSGLKTLVDAIASDQTTPAVYGRCMNFVEKSGKQFPVWVEPFDERRLAMRCIVSQPGSLIRRRNWESIGGVDPNLHMAMDYDLWWRLFKDAGPMKFVDVMVAVNREHASTKTKTQRRLHYREAMMVVQKHYGRRPLKWWLAQPYAVWFKSLCR